LEKTSEKIELILNNLKDWIQTLELEPPQIFLNKHCPYCPFQDECELKAREIDHLSLLRGLSEKEIRQQNKRGIFTVNQYSYTYRPSKRKRNKGGQNLNNYYSLKALAIRDNKIYVAKSPEISLSNNLIFLDVEGIPDQEFYYLIGLIIITDNIISSFSFWADERSDEEGIWKAFLERLTNYDDFTLLHYGKYEISFLERMKKKYGGNEILVEKIISNSINVLSLIYANIYFPTYSNSLKDIGFYLGYKWSEKGASGLKSIVWRYEWENTRNEFVKQQLITYNLEDCLATKCVAEAIVNLSGVGKLDMTFIEDIKTERTSKFEKSKYIFKELEIINKCAYFDYQREKIFFRNDKRRVASRLKKKKITTEKYPINKSIEIATPESCYECNSSRLGKINQASKTLVNLKFFEYGVKRWIVRYSTRRIQCYSCGSTFLPIEFSEIKGKYGHELNAWMVHQNIALRQSFNRIQENLQATFNLYLPEIAIQRSKSKLADFYSITYERILEKLRQGKLVHADETTVNIKGVNAYIWVFTSLEEVVYIYTPTRRGEILEEVLKGFTGVLVSDFYSAYDSVNCSQQKCLVHLIRDMNDDLHCHFFDEEYKEIVRDFSYLIKAIVDTIDKYGLLKKHLHKHKKEVADYMSRLLSNKYKSQIAIQYQKKFKKYQEKLFTFLDHDDVPWNNNNAENAIKVFAAYRKIADGCFAEKGIKNYLKLLSIYQTCKYKDTDFLRFLLSKQTGIDSIY
jgi:hypothetical protein